MIIKDTQSKSKQWNLETHKIKILTIFQLLRPNKKKKTNKQTNKQTRKKKQLNKQTNKTKKSEDKQWA